MTFEQYDLSSMTTSELICLFAIGAVSNAKLDTLSERMIELGADSDSLYSVLATQDLRADEKAGLFENALTELGYQLPDKQDAALMLSSKVAKEILSGDRTPYDGATFIWKNIITF